MVGLFALVCLAMFAALLTWCRHKNQKRERS